MKLHTKSDFTALMHRFLDPLLPLYSEGGARLHLGDTGVTYPGRTIEMDRAVTARMDALWGRLVAPTIGQSAGPRG